MIKYDPKTWLKPIFQLYKSDTLRILFPEMLILSIFTWGVCYSVSHWVDHKTILSLKSTTSVHSLIGIVLGLLLVFRTNTSYDRWWEGRKLWGQLINCSRNAAVKIKHIVPEGNQRDYLMKLLSAYPSVLKDHLRNRTGKEHDEFFKKWQEGLSHRPNYIADQLYEELTQLLKSGIITGEMFLSIDKEIAQLTEITGACERIKNTPIPFSYNLFMKKFLFIYIVTLPLGFVSEFGYWTIPVTLFIFYVLFSLEILAEEIEDPFGTDENDLPMDEMATKIKQNISDINRE
jgi:ion channel-forming bestrophin family protein